MNREDIKSNIENPLNQIDIPSELSSVIRKAVNKAEVDRKGGRAKTKFNEKMIVIAAVLLILLTSSLAIAGVIQSAYKDKMKSAKELRQNRDSSKLLAEVNGVQIRENDVKATKIMVESASEVGDADVLDKLINQELLLQEGKRLNLVPTDEEVKKTIEEQMNGFEKYASEQDILDFKAVLEGLGLTEKQYWEDYIPDKYKDMMTAGKVSQKLRREIHDIAKTDAEFDDLYKRAYDKMIKELREAADLKIYK